MYITFVYLYICFAIFINYHAIIPHYFFFIFFVKEVYSFHSLLIFFLFFTFLLLSCPLLIIYKSLSCTYNQHFSKVFINYHLITSYFVHFYFSLSSVIREKAFFFNPISFLDVFCSYSLL